MSKTSHRRIVIGDVHGHYDGLMRTRGVAPGSDDQVYFLGDLIDRGPERSGCRFCPVKFLPLSAQS